jgi:hypothetical protein
VELPQELMSFTSGDLRVFAAMSSDAIGFSVGDERQAELAAFMDAEADNGRTFFSVDYDMAAPIEFQRKMSRHFPGVASDGGGDADQIRKLAENIQNAYLDWLGRSRVEVSFGNEGLQVDTEMTFK